MVATWLLTIGAGISLLVGQGGGLYLLAFAVLLGIALEVAAAWSLIVGSVRTFAARTPCPGDSKRPNARLPRRQRMAPRSALTPLPVAARRRERKGL